MPDTIGPSIFEFQFAIKSINIKIFHNCNFASFFVGVNLGLSHSERNVG